MTDPWILHIEKQIQKPMTHHLHNISKNNIKILNKSRGVIMHLDGTARFSLSLLKNTIVERLLLTGWHAQTSMFKTTVNEIQRLNISGSVNNVTKFCSLIQPQLV